MFRSILHRTRQPTIPSLCRSFITYHPLHQQSIPIKGSTSTQPPASQKHKIVCALYEGGEIGRKNPGILGCAENALGLREWLTSLGHEFIVTTDKDGPNSVVERNLHDATVVISQPFWPIYLDEARLEKAKKLQHAITAGVGSDHVNLDAAVRHGITVTEVTGSNVVSVAEHVIMMILSLVRNYLPAHEIAKNGGWDIAKIVDHAYDLEEMHVGTVAAGRIGVRVLQRLKPFGVHLHYTDKARLKPALEKELGVTYHPTVRSLVRSCDVVTINAPLHPETENLFNADMIASMKRGSYLINTARARIVERDAVVQAVTTGHLKGYAGDVWYPQPAPPDHPWRRMPHNGMTPHYSGSTLSAQARYAAGTREILQCIFENKPIRPEYLIVANGALVSPAYSIAVDLIRQQDARTLKQSKDPYKEPES